MPGTKPSKPQNNKKKVSARFTPALTYANDISNDLSNDLSNYQSSITGNSFAQLSVTLRQGQMVIGDGGSLAYVREGVKLGKLSANSGVKGAVGRLLAGQALLFNKYEGLSETMHDAAARTITFASSLPGEIIEISLSPGEEYTISRGGYLASSPNVKVTGTLNLRGILEIGQEEGFILPKIKCDSNSDGKGTLWIAGYGSIRRHDLTSGQKLLVDNGLFFACNASTQYELTKLGKSWTSTILGGEGIGMKFVGPCTVYTQSHNLNDLAAKIESLID
jgi:uncharacterized protein (AIM24 family)